jgi:glutathione S-transferase
MLKLYDYPSSGNCYKIRLLLNQLGRSYQRVSLAQPLLWRIDILKGESRTAEFLESNPVGKTPVLEIQPGQYLAESNAIIYYLADGTDFLPMEKWARAQVMQWLFFEQNSHEPNIATVRFWLSISQQAEQKREVIIQKQELGYAALQVMEEHLSKHDYFVGDRYTIADIALYAYTHVAEEGNFDLSKFPAILAWFDRVASQANYLMISAD